MRGVGLGEVVEVLDLDWLGQKGIGAELVGAMDFLKPPDVGQDDDVQSAEFGFAVEPLEQVKAVPARKMEIEDDDGREGKDVSVDVFALAPEIADRLIHILNGVNGILQARFVERSFEEQHSVDGIVDE